MKLVFPFFESGFPHFVSAGGACCLSLHLVCVKLIIKSLLYLIATSSTLGALAQTAGDGQAKNLDSVIVTGQFRPGTLRNSAYRVKVISNELIRARAVTDVGSLLNNELGYRFSTDYTLAESDLSVMGMGGNNVKILLDGVPLVDRGSTKQSLSQIDINTIDRIEMVEGPMSVVYGTDALAAVINIITRKTKEKNQFNAYLKMQEESVGDTYQPLKGNGVHQESMGVDGSIGNWQAALSVSRNDFGGWRGQAD
ncbi:MAG: TonB-dependent receptor plug domain-containing protein [Flavihumibacter sp.]